MAIALFDTTSTDCSRVITRNYSTSFYSAINLLHPELRKPVFNIYGFVRLADEIVDSFHEHDKKALLQEFKKQTFDALHKGISLNPILHSFQKTVHDFNISDSLITAFFSSMESDLTEHKYDRQGYEEYIYGSAEVVGLMCLHIFCEADRQLYDRLQSAARALGAAFQKVNFLRDMQADYHELSRIYFPGCDFDGFNEKQKQQIEKDIEVDFANAYEGIVKLPLKARFGVYVAYKYYYSLFSKIKSTRPEFILKKRISIPNYYKSYILLRATVKNHLRLI